MSGALAYMISQHYYRMDGYGEETDEQIIGVFLNLEDAKAAIKQIFKDAENKEGKIIRDIELNDDTDLTFKVPCEGIFLNDDGEWKDNYVEYSFSIEEISVNQFSEDYVFNKEESER